MWCPVKSWEFQWSPNKSCNFWWILGQSLMQVRFIAVHQILTISMKSSRVRSSPAYFYKFRDKVRWWRPENVMKFAKPRKVSWSLLKFDEVQKSPMKSGKAWLIPVKSSAVRKVQSCKIFWSSMKSGRVRLIPEKSSAVHKILRIPWGAVKSDIVLKAEVQVDIYF